MIPGNNTHLVTCFLSFGFLFRLAISVFRYHVLAEYYHVAALYLSAQIIICDELFQFEHQHDCSFRGVLVLVFVLVVILLAIQHSTHLCVLLARARED